AQLAWRERAEVAPVEDDLPRRGRPAVDESKDRARQHRLAGPRLANDAERHAPVERERHAVDRGHGAGGCVERGAHVAHVEQRLIAHSPPRTSTRPRIRSPTKLRLSTVRNIAVDAGMTGHTVSLMWRLLSAIICPHVGSG